MAEVSVVRRRAPVLVLVVLALLSAGLAAQDRLAEWEADIRAFEEADRRQPPPRGGIVFAGSSSIRLWKTLRQDFDGLPVVNRGFGGSQIRDVSAFAHRIILPLEPRLIVFYCGSNDVASRDRTVPQVVSDYRRFVAIVHDALPATRIAFISAAPNPARWHLRWQFRELNARIAALSRADARLAFIDVWPHMVGSDGRPRPDIFVDDRLHMNEKGYVIWSRVVGDAIRTLDSGSSPSAGGPGERAPESGAERAPPQR